MNNLCSLEGDKKRNPIKEIAGVCSVMEPLRTISNSCVKHNSGDDTAGVALWDNSSMPALTFEQQNRKPDRTEDQKTVLSGFLLLDY